MRFPRLPALAGLILLTGFAPLFLAFYANGVMAETETARAAMSEANAVRQSIEFSLKSRDEIQRVLGQSLTAAGKVISEHLNGRNVESITVDELKQLRDLVSVSEITLFARKGEDIASVQSTDPEDIGLSTKDWGMWHNAFDLLLKGRPTKTWTEIPEGFTYENAWVGPLGISDGNLEKSGKYVYFLYGYYHDAAKTGFLVNPMYKSDILTQLTEKSGPSSAIERFQNQGAIRDVAIINVKPFLEGEMNIITNPELGHPIAWGTMKQGVANEKAVVRQVAGDGKSQAILAGAAGLYRVYLPLPSPAPNDQRVLAVTVNQQPIGLAFPAWVFAGTAAILLLSLLVAVRMSRARSTDGTPTGMPTELVAAAEMHESQ